MTTTLTRATTWADAYGVWHASITDTGDDQQNAATARHAILSELRVRVDQLAEHAMNVKRCRPTRTVPGEPARIEYVETWEG